MRKSGWLFALLASLLGAGAVPVAQAQVSGPPSGPPAPRAFPNANAAAVAEHLARAKSLAGKDLAADYAHRCILDPLYPQRTRAIQQYMLIDPAKVFDNLYFVGQHGVSAWVVSTSQGLVLLDTLDNPDEAKTVIIGGMKKLGLDPAQIKYVVVTHAHGDHFGGATYIKTTYGPHIMASAIDWDGMAKLKAGGGGRGGPAEWAALVPDHDMDITDGEKFTVGDETFNFYITPGHTPGTVSMIFKTADHGVPHTVSFYGGGGMPQTPEAKRQQAASQGRFADLAKAAGADVLISNHQTQDGSLQKLEELKYRLPGAPHPYVLGAETVARYYSVQQECARVSLARDGMTE